VHNILAGTFREQRIVLNTLRYISNELQFLWCVLASARPVRRSAAMCNSRDALRSFR
jgi:hypothetical protein